MSEPFDSHIRPRRLRLRPQLREMLQRVTLRRRDVIVPVFVRDGSGVRNEVPSMPGVFQMSVDVATEWLNHRAKEGFGAYLVFGVIERQKKDAVGRRHCLVQRRRTDRIFLLAFDHAKNEIRAETFFRAMV